MEEHRSPSQRVGSAVGHLVVACALTWPLAWRSDQLPLGREPVATVPRFNLWTLRWTADRLPHGLSGWWDAPIFWPTRGAFAFSEPQPLTGAAYALVRLVAGDGRAYAVVLIATLALNGIAAAALARRLGASPAVAFAAGVVAQALPFAFDQLGVLQLVALWPMFAALACLVAWLDEPRARRAVLLGLALAASLLTCGYYAVLFATCLLVAAPFAVDRSWAGDGMRRIAGVLLAVGTALLVAAPIVLGQQARLEGQRWRPETIAAGSATWSQWLPTGRLWPGLPLVALAGFGAWLGRDRRVVRILLVLAVAGMVLSVGWNLAVGGLRPWPALVDHLAPFARLRSPFRAAAVVQVALVALSVGALQWLWDRPQRWQRAAVPLVVVASVLAAGVGPGRLVAPPAEPGRWADALAGQRDAGAVVFLPAAAGPSAAAFEPTTGRMLQALDLGHPMLNGYSGFFPTDHLDLLADLHGFPDARSLAALQDRSVRYVVIDTAAFDFFDRRIARRLGYRELAHGPDAWLLEVPR